MFLTKIGFFNSIILFYSTVFQNPVLSAKILRGRILYCVSLFCLLIFIPFFILFIVIIRPFVTVKVSNLFTLRVGHLVTENWIMLHETLLSDPNRDNLYVFFLNQEISNPFVLNEVKKHFSSIRCLYVKIPVISSIFKKSYFPHSHEPIWEILVWLSSKSSFIRSLACVHVNSNSMRESFSLENKFKSTLNYTLDFKVGNPAPATKKTVLLFYRNDEYLNMFAPHLYYQARESYNARNNSWENYKSTVEYLLHLGFRVIRMGRFRQPVHLDNLDFWDYGGSKETSPQKDFELCLNADFIISSGVGLDVLPLVWFKKPTFFLHIGEITDAFISYSQETLVYYLPKSINYDNEINSPQSFGDFISNYKKSTNHSLANSVEVKSAIDEFLEYVYGHRETMTRPYETEVNYWNYMLQYENRLKFVLPHYTKGTVINKLWLSRYRIV
jgi:putative glycosyltransferase (TIGR04372 family)